MQEIGSGVNNLKLGSKKEDLRLVSIYGKNCEEWLLTDMAMNIYGITTVAIYDTLGAESMQFIVDQCDLDTLFTSCSMFVNILKQPKLKSVSHLVYFD